MKNRIYILMAIGFLFRLPGMAQTPECGDSGKQMRDQLAIKRYKEAAAVFEKMPIGCAVNDETIFADSQTVLEYIIKQSKNEDTKKAHIQTLIGLYDQYDKAHPQNTKSLSVKKAMVLDQQKAGTEDQIFALLDKSFRNDRANCRRPLGESAAACCYRLSLSVAPCCARPQECSAQT